MAEALRDAKRLFFRSFSATVVFRLPQMVARFEVFLIARRAMRHMFPLLFAFERPVLGGASCKVELSMAAPGHPSRFGFG